MDAQNEMLLKEISSLLTEVKEKIDKEQWEEANSLVLGGLELLGNAYVSTKRIVIDDSGQKLLAAYFLEDENRFQSAVNLRVRILEGRFDSFKKKIEAESQSAE